LASLMTRQLLMGIGTAMDGRHPDDHPWIPYMDGWQRIWISRG
jgi:hypothetical protein